MIIGNNNIFHIELSDIHILFDIKKI